MGLAFKSPASSALLNSTFLDKTQDDATIGKLDLNNAQPESGASVSNVQAVINRLIPYRSSVVIVSASAQLDLENNYVQYIPLVGDAGPQNLDTTPFSSPPENGTQIYLIGTDDTNTVTLQFLDDPFGAYINGNATLKRGYCIGLVYNSDLQRYVETSRNF